MAVRPSDGDASLRLSEIAPNFTCFGREITFFGEGPLTAVYPRTYVRMIAYHFQLKQITNLRSQRNDVIIG